MLRVDRTQFMVAGCQTSHVWLEVLNGDDAGLRVSVPVYDDSYSDAVTEAVQDLSEGEVVEAALVSESESSPNWRVAQLF